MDVFYARSRSTATSNNGEPGLSTSTGSGLVTTNLTHVAFTRDSTGTTRIYIDGDEVSAGNSGGNLSNWDNTMSVLVGNEATGNRPWLGTICLAAIYDEALTATAIMNLHSGGCPVN